MQMDADMQMPGLLSSDYPASRDSSGTSWIPDSSPMHALHFGLAGWEAMFHANVFLRYTDQNTFNGEKRGDEEIDSTNWFMLMARKPLGEKDQVALRAMLSLEPLTIGGRGYPLLLQTGETWGGERLIDRQHPHDLLGEIAALWSRKTSQVSSLFFYFGLPGEPALGPPVYLHRPSAQNIPDAPLGHHWQDSTHIVFGVFTGGLVYKDFKVDASVFNGREPDENRYDIDHPRFNSYSARLSFNPTENSSYQVSLGYLRNPEAIEPGIDVWRGTASAIWNFPLKNEKNLAAFLVWGMNDPDEGDPRHSFLMEADYSSRKNSIFGRAEFIEKPAEDLGIEGHDGSFGIASLSLGAARNVLSYKSFFVSLGVMGTLHLIGEELEPFYGDLPFSFQVFVKISPALMKMQEHEMHM